MRNLRAYLAKVGFFFLFIRGLDRCIVFLPCVNYGSPQTRKSVLQIGLRGAVHIDLATRATCTAVRRGLE